MVDRERSRTKKKESPVGGPPHAAVERLPYAIELWDAGAQDVERVIARAVNATLARAIFKGAQAEYPGRRLTLRHGERILARSGD